MLSHLKVKVYSLSAEMTYIRRQEEKWKTRARLARTRIENIQQHGPKVEYAESNFWSQRHHRIKLKEDARTAHLAYGCMKGIPYSKMEVVCYGPLKGYNTYDPNWKGIEATVERFSKDEPDPQHFMQRFAEWLADAQKWYEGNPERIMAMNNARLAARAIAVDAAAL